MNAMTHPVAGHTLNVFIKTYGCQMNEYDSDKMFEVLNLDQPMLRVNTPEEADIVLMNTCSIREKAQEKVFSELGRWRRIKAKKPHLIIGVGGCVASQEGDVILKRAPYVDLIFGPQTIHRLPSLLAEHKQRQQPVMDISFPEIEKFDHLPTSQTDQVSAYVSIMEGCNKYCSFCVVPYTRGTEISRPFDDVLAEVMELAEQGVREIHLLGQNVNDYAGVMHTGEIADLALLIHYIAALDNVARIRFTTSHPSAFSDRLIQAFAEEPKLVNHLHLPVQSGSDRVLAAMKRNYTALEYKSRIRKLRAVRPDISLSSDFIVGFPGETDAEFAATLALVEEIGFDHSFSFIYSKRPGTPAANLPDDILEGTKKQRLALLQARLNQQANAYSKAMVGKTYPILVTGQAKKHASELQGRTENNRVVNFKGPPALIGQLIQVKITAAHPNSLRGEWIA